MDQSSSSTKLFHSLLFTTSKGMNLQQQFLVFAFCPINFHHGWDHYLPNSFYQQISHPKCMKFIKFMTWEGNPERSWNENFRLIPSRKIPGSRDFAKSRPGNPGIENPWSRLSLLARRKKMFSLWHCPKRGGPFDFLAHFQEVHFWSIKRVYFFHNAKIFNFEPVFRFYI